MPTTVTYKSRIPLIIAGLDPRMNAAVKAGAELIAERAKELAPDRPEVGEGLVESIHVEETDEGGSLVLAGDDDVYYGHMVEFGTVRAGAQPFLVPATEERKEAVVALATAALKTI